MLDGFQAGLSWTIILRKRDAFRKAFRNFDPEKVARFGEAEVGRLLENPGIVRSRSRSRRPSRAEGRLKIPERSPPAFGCQRRCRKRLSSGDSSLSAR
jgi:hypothetical protein